MCGIFEIIQGREGKEGRWSLPVTSQIALNIRTIRSDEAKTLELERRDALSVFWILKFFLKSVNGNG